MNITELIGKTITDIQKGNDRIEFTVQDGSKYAMYHVQDCCESVEVEDIIGDLNDLIGFPVTMAEEVVSGDDYPIEGMPAAKDNEESYTWTFYKLATIKGYVTIRWYGQSNGYYSESVNFERIGNFP